MQLPSVTVGNIRITTTFKSLLRVGKSGSMVTDSYMYVSYRNLETGRTATTADLRKAGIKNRQRPTVKLTPENVDFLFQRAMAAESGQINPKRYANLLGAPSFGVPTSIQEQQFKDALKAMFDSANPSQDEKTQWDAMVDLMTPKECQEFYQRYKRDLAPGFKGYHSVWSTTDVDGMVTLTASDIKQYYRTQAEARNLAALQKANRDAVRPKLLDAARRFLRDLGKQSKLDQY